MRRMDRYKETEKQDILSRSNKNQELYQNIGSNTRYTNFTDVTNANAIDLSTTRNSKTREGYQQMKGYQEVIPTPKIKRELDEFNHLYQDRENRIYDINNVLEEARKNRLEKDALEEKRKLKNTSYNILAGLNPEELEKYRKEKKSKVIKPDEEELRELIDTITSKTLAGDIKAASNLLSDLMATSIMDKVEKPTDDEEVENTNTNIDIEASLSLSKEILDKEQLEKLNQIKLVEQDDDYELDNTDEYNQTMDNDFYTRSMDLSEEDFDLGEEFNEHSLPLGMKILIFLIIIAIIGVATYFILHR